MKTILAYFFILFGFSVFAQQAEHLALPKIHWKSYGYQKQIEQAKIAYYKSDSLEYETTMVEVFSFNKEGNIIQKYIRVFGKYGSETAFNYVYTNGLLDSINTYASAKNFNTQQKFHYDKNGRLTHSTSTGVYANFTDTYSYDINGKIELIERKHKSGVLTKATFNNKENYIHEKETTAKGKITERYFVYDNDDLFAYFTTEEPTTVYFTDNFRRIEFKIELKENNILEYILGKRKENQANFNSLAGLREEKNGKIIFDIPVQSQNENKDWTKRLQLDKRFFGTKRNLVFAQIIYADGTKSGSTDYDMIFDKKVAGNY